MYPCYIPVLGELKGSRSYKTYPLQKYNFFLTCKAVVKFFFFFLTKTGKALFKRVCLYEGIPYGIQLNSTHTTLRYQSKTNT